MQRMIVSLLTCVAVALSGCYVNTDPQTILHHESGQKNAIAKAPWRGEFLLYKLPEHPATPLEGVGTPIASQHLDKGQRLGFTRNSKGEAVAVAGDREIPLADGSYEWVMKADPHQLEPGKTALLVVVVVVVVAATVIVIWTAADLNRHGFRLKL